MPLPRADFILKCLQKGEVNLEGEFMWGSNYTFMVDVCYEGEVIRGVYKPTRGERPLWDFPTASLARREAAAYLISEALGWELVPPTVYRREAPIGPGSLQLFIEHNPEYHYFNFSQTDRQRLQPVALFDIMINNADRKGSHVLIDPENHLWLIDHGICFHVEDKIRTVIWDFAGESIPKQYNDEMRAFLEKLNSSPDLVERIGKLINSREIAALKARTTWLLERGRYPNPHPDRRPYPWPPI